MSLNLNKPRVANANEVSGETVSTSPWLSCATYSS